MATWGLVGPMLLAVLIGMILGGFAQGVMMHRMMSGLSEEQRIMDGQGSGMMSMMGDQGQMGSMMNGSEGGTGMFRSTMMARCRYG